MIIARYDDDVLEQAFGIDMSGVEGFGTGAGWGRVAPGRATDDHHHDETELFVIVSGRGEFLIDGERHEAVPGTVVLFEPFESHVLRNTGPENPTDAGTDLVFFTQYWRDAQRAAHAASAPVRTGFGDRPVFVFSTPPTPNGDLHLGHLAGPYLGADAFTRFQRMNGTEAYHLTGSDDYQSYVLGAARQGGRTPAETAAHYSAEIAETLRLMDIPLDQYTVTDQDPGYRDGLKDFFSRLVASGEIAVTAHEALYDARTGAYLYEADVTGGCPGCGAATCGNLCEECGEPNTVADLADPRSTATGSAPRPAPAARWTLPLHAYAGDVRAHHRRGRVPARLRELADRLFRRPALDLPLTHPSDWGVEPREDDTDGQVIWVWPEMSYGFLHGIQSLGARLGRPWRAAEPSADWKIVHFFGYDNSFYHSVLYPVLYQLAHPGWTPDIDYHVNEFYLLEGEKFSTSRRHAIWGKEVLSPDTVDAVRYFLAATRPEGLRTDFRRAAYEATLADTLIGTWQQWLNDLGARVAKHHGGRAPDAGNWTPEHTAFLARLGTRRDAVTGALGNDSFSLTQAAAELDGIVRDTVRFTRAEGLLTDTPGWEDENRTAVALELAAARLLAHAAAPLMPRFAARLAAALDLETPRTWPRTVELLTPGAAVDLSDAVFFQPSPAAQRAQGADAAEPVLTPWLTQVARTALRLGADEPIAHRTLTQLAAGSLQAVTVQYQILDALDVDLSMDELLHGGTLAELAAVIAERAEPAAVAALTSGEAR
ncbi:methionyl-tRNA synthetase [Streptomyces sp. Ag109_G2-6]|uniref:class I tRNA ligase family protein n=1 Tax=Streptomyces TaxID=1883 RepID=UPI0009A4D111|nr:MULTISPECIES: class I tRNA ligase family protein [Streptomyces]RPF25446.1 methionyl-tRNA synthetase [Streptomyces sp. Ag109_G2-6]